MTNNIFLEWAQTIDDFYKSLENDLNTPQCIAIMHKVSDKINSKKLSKTAMQMYAGTLSCFMYELGLIPEDDRLNKMHQETVRGVIRDIRQSANNILKSSQ